MNGTITIDNNSTDKITAVGMTSNFVEYFLIQSTDASAHPWFNAESLQHCCAFSFVTKSDGPLTPQHLSLLRSKVVYLVTEVKKFQTASLVTGNAFISKGSSFMG